MIKIYLYNNKNEIDRCREVKQYEYLSILLNVPECIAKVEKKAKNIETEEMNKLHLSPVYDDDNNIIGLMPVESNDFNDLIKMEDYIDVTIIVKGNM